MREGVAEAILLSLANDPHPTGDTNNNNLCRREGIERRPSTKQTKFTTITTDPFLLSP